MNPLSRLAARDRRALLLGAAIVIPALVYGFALRPYWRMRTDLRTAVAVQRDLLSRERELLAQAREFPSRAAVADALTREHEGRLFSGPNLVAAGGELVRYVGEAARASHVLVETLETGPATPATGGLTQLDVAVRAQGDLEGVLAFLLALERGSRLVTVGTLVIERSASGAARAPRQETLIVRAAVSGYSATAPDAEAAR